MFEGFDFTDGMNFTERLRFDLSHLEIKHNHEWTVIPKFEAKAEFKDTDYTRNVKLTDVLFDTGNEAGYCHIGSPYKEPFEEKFPLIDIESKNKTLAITQDSVKFCFSKSIFFLSKIGFSSATHPDWLDRINIGINSIIQFISLIYPIDIIESESMFLCFPSEE